ncbi:hypothetical protein ACFYMW_30375 [Streptomyces sp. NPDC006692]|uniref:hypothetical protein n=1 Tax=Streptomyces sp. NPDC006692 TaxID=3364758 RepID=UPI0036B407E5
MKALAVTAAAVAALGVGTGAAHASTARPADVNKCQSVYTYRTGNEYMEVLLDQRAERRCRAGLRRSENLSGGGESRGSDQPVRVLRKFRWRRVGR